MPRKQFYVSKRIVLICMIGYLTMHSLQAQLNLKVGYNLNYSPYTSLNSLLSTFNEDRPWLSDRFSNLHFANGLHLGLRYRGEFVGTEFSWDRFENERTAQGIQPDSEDFSLELDYLVNRFGIGLEGYNQFFGLGANVFYERFGVSSAIANQEDNLSIMKSDRFGSKIYLILTVPGGDMLSISLQPYIAIPFTGYDLSPIANFLNVPNSSSSIQKDLHFGFSIVFYNGAQRN